ncbi:hypothetical protein [Candidatus Magnetomonas plexicatena]|uniref:hypothetical protein n=1 Tax=Candidatus Magnetomonas plexicatena TaxID=2552947 RepID=UPI0011011EA2|nr:hypothetical protein E2O03_014825 [Nitrospirales bacterium LBB_01]
MLDLEKEYKALIDACAKEKRDHAIENGHSKHAAYLLTKFFETAITKVNIYSGALSNEVFGDSDLQATALDFIGRENTKLTIVVETDVREDEPINKFVEFLSKSDKKNIDIRLFNISEKKGINHFAVMDESGYRFEIDEKKMKAIANFGDKKMTDKLYKIFDYLCKNSESIFSQDLVLQGELAY